jgi:hypothetical protein
MPFRIKARSESVPAPHHRAGPISRRDVLKVGSLAMSGLCLTDLLRLRTEASMGGTSIPDTSVILVWLAGGPPQMETYDMKPDAPVEYRGELKPVHTNVPGIDVCELLTRHTKIADKFSLIRSITHDFSDHGGGSKRVMTGRIPKSGVGLINDAPATCAVVAKMHERKSGAMPPAITILNSGTLDTMTQGAAYLGPAYEPFQINGDPNSPTWAINDLGTSHFIPGRLEDRKNLLAGIDRLRRDMDSTGAMEAMDRYSQKAFGLLTSAEARAAFDLTKESDQTRDFYGRHVWGQEALLARRLVEAGSSLVTVSMAHPNTSGPLPFGVLHNWDSHAVNCPMFIDCRYRFPLYDQALCALIEDIHQRGLDKKVMIVAMGEFGRTPLIQQQVGSSSGVLQPGRDHWPQTQSVLVSGGGLRMGQVVGSTTAKCEMPKDRPLTPNDLWATVYRHLGIDYNHAFLDLSGRPMPILPFGEPISELI